MSYIDEIVSLGACQTALDWLRAEDYPTLAEAWAACHRGDWMLWLYARVHPSEPWSAERRPLVAAAAACARTALSVYETRHPGDVRVRRCLDITDAWCRGEATVGDVVEARRAAYAADDDSADAAAYAAAYVTYAAAYVAYVAYVADADVTYAAAYVACAAYVADADDAAYAADIVRRMLPCPTLGAR